MDIHQVGPPENKVASPLVLAISNILSAWKPLKGPVHDWPLAICDAQSLDVEDLIPGDVVSIEKTEENMLVHYNARQKWYYLSNQQPSELPIFRQADSDHRHGWYSNNSSRKYANGDAGLPHAAFANPLPPPENTVLRESIEVRAMVFFKDRK